MAVTHSMYAAGLKNVIQSNLSKIDSSGDQQLTLSLMSSAYIDNVVIATDEYWAGISADQISTGTHYTPGGVTIDGISSTTTGNATLLLSSTDVVFCTSGSIAAWAGVVRATSYLVSFIDFDGEQESVDGTFRVNWNSSGLIRFTVTT